MFKKNAWELYDEGELGRLEAFSQRYRAFLDAGKTERECVREGVRLAQAAGFRDLQEAVREGTPLRPGDRLYLAWRKKSLLAFVIGMAPLSSGMRILGAHIDSPRIDLKQVPLFEDGGLGYLDTHYYGGIKKYQWAAMPLSLHGVVCRKDGTTVELSLGEKDDEPVLYITDLLIHLSHELMEKPAAKVFEGEALDVLIGSRPLKGAEKEPVKAALLQLLRERYGIEEEDFLSAELELVPAGHSREVGLDRSMIAGYGHDDRVCAFPSLAAVLDYEGIPEATLCAILTDKEEIGSVGATGMESTYFADAVAELCALCGDGCGLAVRRCLHNSRMLSSDVSAGFDPHFASSFEKKNAALVGHGVCFNKYTGVAGKSHSNDADAEYIARLRQIMDRHGVDFQAELGRVDAGGGGTIAFLCARYGMQVIDCGIPVLSMHAPCELISKADLWEEYKAYCAFLQDA